MVATLSPAMATLLHLREEVRELPSSPDILAKFSKVAASTASIEDNRARENARENIRKKLAMESGREKQDSCDLQLCFMNEIASDDESSETLEDGREDFSAASAIVGANISQKEGQIIVPMVPQQQQRTGSGTQGGLVGQPSKEAMFRREVGQLQSVARQGLIQARDSARLSIEDRINTRRQGSQRLCTLLGLPQVSKLNRRTLSRLNVAQLQLIQNDHLAQIEALNEELVGLLVSRDDLGMEQDAMLTDIEDMSEFINIKKA